MIFALSPNVRNWTRKLWKTTFWKFRLCGTRMSKSWITWYLRFILTKTQTTRAKEIFIADGMLVVRFLRFGCDLQLKLLEDESMNPMICARLLYPRPSHPKVSCYRLKGKRRLFEKWTIQFTGRNLQHCSFAFKVHVLHLTIWSGWRWNINQRVSYKKKCKLLVFLVHWTFFGCGRYLFSYSKSLRCNKQ